MATLVQMFALAPRARRFWGDLQTSNTTGRARPRVCVEDAEEGASGCGQGGGSERPVLHENGMLWLQQFQLRPCLQSHRGATQNLASAISPGEGLRTDALHVASPSPSLLDVTCHSGCMKLERLGRVGHLSWKS